MKQTAAIRKQLALPKDVTIIATSSEKGTGIEELRSLLASAIDNA